MTTMNDYIEREKVLGIINELQSVCATEVPEDKADIYNDVFDEVYGEMRTIPAADVRPERHGRWVYQEPDDQYSWKPWLCSACKMPGGKHTTAYCPHCGAYMDGTDR